jgi:TonB family protein
MAAVFLSAQAWAAASLDVPISPTTASAPRVVVGPFHADMTRKHCFRPSYPREARQAGATGVTKLEFVVDATGAVTRITVLHSAGDTPAHVLLDQAAIDDIASCPLQPARNMQGEPVSARLTIDFDWKLE